MWFLKIENEVKKKENKGTLRVPWVRLINREKFIMKTAHTHTQQIN